LSYVDQDQLQLAVIGTHSSGYKPGSTPKNNATLINEHYSIFEDELGKETPSSAIAQILPRRHRYGNLGGGGNNENLSDLAKVIDTASKIIDACSSPHNSALAGPIAMYFSPIAAIAINALDQHLSDWTHRTPIETAITTEPMIRQGILQRSVLAEAALQTILRIKNSEVENRLRNDILAKYASSGLSDARVQQLALKLVPVLASAGYHILVGGQTSNQHIRVSEHPSRINSSGERDSPQPPTPTGTAESWSSADVANTGAFLSSVRNAHVRRVDLPPHKTGVATTGSDLVQESLFATLYPFVKKGVKIARPYIITAARNGLAKVDSFLARQQQERPPQEAFTESPPHLTDLQATEHIITRAIVAECALQVVIEQNPSTLGSLVVFGSGSPDGHFFDCFLQTVQKLGPVVERVAPLVLIMTAPLVLGAINGDLHVGIDEGRVEDYRADRERNMPHLMRRWDLRIPAVAAPPVQPAGPA
jgi:hypothetical protein